MVWHPMIVQAKASLEQVGSWVENHTHYPKTQQRESTVSAGGKLENRQYVPASLVLPLPFSRSEGDHCIIDIRAMCTYTSSCSTIQVEGRLVRIEGRTSQSISQKFRLMVRGGVLACGQGKQASGALASKQ